jgi:hypothetical protein
MTPPFRYAAVFADTPMPALTLRRQLRAILIIATCALALPDIFADIALSTLPA